MTIEEQILEAMSRWLSRSLNRTVEVKEWDEYHYIRGPHECEHVDSEITFYYVDKDSGSRVLYTHEGTLSGIIGELT